MMPGKLYLVLLLLSIFVICSICDEQQLRKTNSTSEGKKNKVNNKNDDNRRKIKYLQDEDEEEEDGVDDYFGTLSGYANNRYTASSFPEGNYRTRSRWSAQSPSSSDDSRWPAQAPSSYDGSRWPAQAPPSYDGSRWPAQAPPSYDGSRWPAQASLSSYDDLLGGNDWSRFELPNAFPSSLPSISYDSNSMSNSGPACHSLVDAQYPIFSDVCGAVPQARYSLPNTLGHRERWQVAQILNTLTSSSSDSSCLRSLRLLICPVFFPPCPTRHEPPAVLPCQSYCRTVKARCAIPSLDILPCETLPYSSDLCPTSQSYSSFAPQVSFPSVNQPSPINNGFSPSNFPMPLSYSSLQSLLSAQGLQSALTQPQSIQSALTQPQQSIQSGLQQSAQPTGSLNLYNTNPYGSDSINPMLVDFQSRLYNNDQRQASRYSPLQRSPSETRSGIDMRPQTETQFSTGQRLSAVPSLVKA